MNKKNLTIIGLVVALVSIIVLAGCSGSSASASTYAPYMVTPAVSGDTYTIPASALTNNNVNFDIQFPQGTASFDAYTLNGQTQVRATYCVPCRGKRFTLKGNSLVCNNCGTIFSAKDGTGVSGVTACKSYPKAAVKFTTAANGDIQMNKADLLTAFEVTLEPGLP